MLGGIFLFDCGCVTLLVGCGGGGGVKLAVIKIWRTNF